MHIHRVLQELGALTNATDPARASCAGWRSIRARRSRRWSRCWTRSTWSPAGRRPGVGRPEVHSCDVRPGGPGQGDDRRPGRQILLGVDGGMTRDNIAEVAAAGADLIVTGSAVFDGKAAAANAAFMLAAVGRGVLKMRSRWSRRGRRFVDRYAADVGRGPRPPHLLRAAAGRRARLVLHGGGNTSVKAACTTSSARRPGALRQGVGRRHGDHRARRPPALDLD